MKKQNLQSGFTLIELLVVIGIIAVLAAIVLIAINPARQFAKSRDAERWSEVNAILSAVGQYTAESKGSVPSGIPSGDPDVPGDWDEISDSGADLCNTLVPEFISALPSDPSDDEEDVAEDDCGTYSTGYYIISDSDGGRISVEARSAEEESDIRVTR